MKRDSEAKYRGLLEAAPDAMVVVDGAGKIVLLNLQTEKQFGYNRDELVGQAVTNIVPEGFAERLIADDLRSAADALAQQIGTGIELVARRKDGTEFPIEIMLSPLQSADGILITAAIRDISVRKAGEERLAHLAALVESSHDAILSKALDGTILSWNRAAERLYGYSAQEIVGRPISLLVPPDRPHEVEDLIERLRLGEVVEPFETVRVCKSGILIDVSLTTSPIRNADGKLTGASTTARDISARKVAEAKYRGLLEAAPDAMVVVDGAGKIVLLNLQTEKQFGYNRDELVGQAVTNIVPEGFAERLIADDLRSAADALAQQIGTGIELVARRKDGTEFPIEIMLSPLESAEGILVTAAIRDISSRKMMEEALFGEKERALITLNSIGDAVISTDIAGNISLLNLVAENMTGWSQREAAGRPMAGVFRIVAAASRETIPNPMANAIDRHGTMHLPSDCLLIRRDGLEVPIDAAVSPIHDRQGQIAGAVIVFRDVSVAQDTALRMAHSAHHDFLTGLPNRLLLDDRIGQAIAFAPRHTKHIAVLFLDLDGFKHVNDSLGHPVGDRLLQSVARRLVDCVRASDTVSRQGGDEFVVLLSEAAKWVDAAIVARRMLAAVAEPHSIDQHDLHITASIGVSVYPDDGENAETLIKNADTAMYQAKENGRQGYQFFTPAMNARAVERHSVEEGLRRALERQEFVLHYQPKVNLMTGAISGAEALVRWSHPTRGLVPPAQFIPVAEDCGLIVPIDNWVLRRACRQARAWADAGLPAMTIAVNVSATELRGDHFVEGLSAVLTETGLDPRSLELELTESVLMKNAESAAAILQDLRGRGVQVSVDDFGTGYSSLSYLRKFAVDSLKIDQSFVSQITSAEDDVSIVTAVISMARSLRLRVIAEGVETLEQLAFLRSLGCDEAQGFYFSRPVPALQFAQLLAAGIPAAGKSVDGPGRWRVGSARVDGEQALPSAMN